MNGGEMMNPLSDMYFLDSNIMLFTQFMQQPPENMESHRGNQPQMPEQQKLSNLEHLVALNDDVYEIVPVDPLAHPESYQNQQELSYSYMTDGVQVNEGLAVLEILYNQPIDAPEYIDVNDLVASQCPDSTLNTRDVPYEQDNPEDDDVIFVAEYKPEAVHKDEKVVTSSSGAPAPRRNPIRKARKNSRALTKDILYDEDYAILESSSDEDVINEAVKKSTRTSSSSLTMKDYRKWPVNGLHERPEYNDTTKQLEKFDYTIRQIRNSVTTKKAQPKITKKVIKKRKFMARRKPTVKSESQEKVPVVELRGIIESTLDYVRMYLVNLETANKLLKSIKTSDEKEEKCETVDNCTDENESPNSCEETMVERRSSRLKEKKDNIGVQVSNNVLQGLELLKTQAILYQVVNNPDSGAVKYFNAIK